MSLPNNSVSFSSPHELQALLRIVYDYLVESFDIYAILFVLMYDQFLIFCQFRVILKQICHLLVVYLQKRAVNFYVFSSLSYHFWKKKVNNSRDDACIVFILLYASQKGRLLFSVALLKIVLAANDVAPIAAKHSVGFATACLAVSQ